MGVTPKRKARCLARELVSWMASLAVGYVTDGYRECASERANSRMVRGTLVALFALTDDSRGWG